MLGAEIPFPVIATLAALLGLASHGASVVLDAYARRLVEAAREAAYFATAPFTGTLFAALFLGAPLGAAELAAMLLMMGGVACLLLERHAHLHEHEPLTHEHGHRHDTHHQHEHEHGPGDPLREPHSHVHQHQALMHEHPHSSDLHHRHRH